MHSKIVDLIYKHLTDDLNESEKNELESWVHASEENESFFGEVSDALQVLKDSTARHERLQRVDVKIAWEKLKVMGLPLEHLEEPQQGRVFRFSIGRIAIAASIVLFIGGGLWFSMQRKGESKREEVVKVDVPKDAKPNTQVAKLVLDDGTELLLDTAREGVLATQGSIKVVKQKNGEITYESGDKGKVQSIFNTVYVPKGSDVVYLTLEDGSKVWLNAESSIRYPIAFTGEERKVTITGEAYFEIARSTGGNGQRKSFVVNKGNMNVFVLGTKFNVNAYENESNIKVTLLEGSVRVRQETKLKLIERTITPGQQAIINDASIKVDDNADIEQILAWKNGKFVFRNTDIQFIMRQMARWYNLDSAEFSSDEVRGWKFTGEISRYNNASIVLQMLEKTGGGKFKVEGKRILIANQ